MAELSTELVCKGVFLLNPSIGPAECNVCDTFIDNVDVLQTILMHSKNHFRYHCQLAPK